MHIFRAISNIFRFNRTNWRAAALCFFAASVFWMFTSLNKNHTTNVTFPLQFAFDNDRYVPVVMPNHISINVSGNGWELLRKSLGIKLPLLNVTLDKPTDVKKIPGSTMTSLVSGQLGSLKINYIVGDTLDLEIDVKDTRRFRLVADLGSVSYKKGFGRISQIVILPDSVEIEGPKSILHKFADSIVLPIIESKISEHYREEIEVVVPNGDLVKRNPPVVEVYFEVGEIEEVVINLSLEIIKKSSQLRIESLQDSITCRIIIPRKLGMEILTTYPPKAVISLKQLQKGEHVIIPEIVGLPPFAHLITVDSVYLTLN